jgi:signal transduction histidine kinase
MKQDQTIDQHSLLNILRQETVQTVVHDLRTPMTVIKGNLLLLLSGMMGQMSNEQQKLIERSVGPLEDLILMTENLLQAVSLEKDDIRLEFSETDLDHLLAEIIEFYQLPFKQRGMQIYREGNTVGAKLHADSFWLKRVLHNLIWNAFKFTPDNGKVILQVRHRDDQGLDLVIQDTGRGIPAEKLGKIFDKFEQAAPRDRKIGTGLGLWICRRVMELHGGSVRVESEEGQGSRFILSLPATRLL